MQSTCEKIEFSITFTTSFLAKLQIREKNVSSSFIYYVVVAIALIGFILVQQGKGANAGASLVVAHQVQCLALLVQVTFNTY